MSAVHWKLRRTAEGWEGIIMLAGASDGPMRGNAIAVLGADPADALLKAGVLAKNIASNPIVAAALPPGTAAAVKAVTNIARAVKTGDVQKVLKRYGGPGAKRLAKALRRFW
jgi:hypothetical protein